MEATITLDAHADIEATDRRLRRRAGIGLILLLPTALVCFVLSLTTARAARCLTYGEGCSSIQVQWILYAFIGSAVLGVLAVAIPLRHLPFPTARGRLVYLHVFAHGTMAAMILARA